mgnify:CR=1 FL=1
MKVEIKIRQSVDDEVSNVLKVTCGSLEELKTKLNKWFSAAANEGGRTRFEILTIDFQE